MEYSIDINLLIIIIVTIVTVILLFTFLWLRIQRRLHKDTSSVDRLSIEIETIKTLAQILGGIFLLASIYLTWNSLWTTQEGQVTERFTRAIEQLGNENISVRLGGIYSLERIAKDSRRDHWAVMEVLCAYVQSWVVWKHPRTIEDEVDPGYPPRLRADIQAIMTVIGRRNPNYDKGNLNLEKTVLRFANLKGANFEGANFWGANLQESICIGTNFNGACLANSYLSLSALSGANLKGANLNQAELQSADLFGANLEEADLRMANLSSTNLSKANLKGANLWSTKGITCQQINNSTINENTKLPRNLNCD
ncbi:pentapeptide repeat-containing protein [bacterium]|nr:pentapeptide repeat-containing protein [bacterium]